ncbi:MAG TPA: hypothetical protein PLV05_13525 [Verrucomicrobiota bacterium]|jgi:hypothetical protein|nr:hypothetical protein [Verrucomicrobiota bacterium]HCL91572.1 hypothetical protein [Limisphaerales bacterium]HRR65416.1 hypothetical protein [Candidatus Paceibacterota bacterium]MDI9372305.1 hypothetical protein [Verrucomicrobiota bacterium]NLH83900.1 hypothetical protein [Verrucomicrobiota bacterium]
MRTRRRFILGSATGVALLALTAWAQVLDLPPRAPNALSGSEFARRVAMLDLGERDREVYAQVMAGNVPDFLRRLCPVPARSVVEGRINSGTYYVTPDYLAVGSDDDYFLAPISPYTAQRIAEALHCTLPTPKMVNQIFFAAEVKLAPAPIPPSAAMTTVPVFRQHNDLVRAQRAEQLPAHPLGALVAGHKKDVVLTARLAANPGKVAIYGWHRTNGLPIQPLYLKHSAAWVDYSQCVRLVQQKMVANETARTVAEVLADPALAGLLSDEGPLAAVRYPTNAPLALQTLTNQASVNRLMTNAAFDERLTSFTFNPEVKVRVNLPGEAAFAAAGKVLLIFYALPNGNSTDQTAGRIPRPGDDWRFDIQHIDAQTRFLRDLIKDRAVVVVYLEAAGKSWPAWRKAHGDRQIPEIVATVKKLFPGRAVEVVLNGHSGGGSFIFGYLNAVDRIPDDVVRIAFLDSNYAYSRAQGHLDKLVKWLSSPRQPSLCVLAYNDAAALLNGTNFVSAAGGTWGKSHAMLRDLAGTFQFTSQTNAGLRKHWALDGRVQFLLKENPERKILHTVQVERNGFIHSLVSGTTNEGRGYEYFGPRAYTRWIRPE